MLYGGKTIFCFSLIHGVHFSVYFSKLFSVYFSKHVEGLGIRLTAYRILKGVVVE